MTPLNLDPNRNYLAEAGTQVDIPEWRKSLSAFGQETRALGSGLKALGAQALGADEARDAALGDYQRTMEGAQSGWRTPAVGKIEDIKFGESGGLGRFGDYLGYQVPKGIAQLGLTIAGGLGGGAVAKGLASKGVKELAKREIKDMALDRAKKQVMTPALQREAAQVALKKQGQRQALGTTVGGIGTGAAMEGGQTYGQFANDPEIGPEAAVGPALAYAGIAGALEWLPIAQGAKAVGLDRTLLRKVIKKDPKLAAEAVKLSKKQRAAKLAAKVGGAAVAGSAVEGLTEGVQNLAQLAAERYAKEDPEWASILPRTPEEWSETWNAAAAGAATGFFARGATAPFAGTRQPEPAPEAGPEAEPQAEPQPEEPTGEPSTTNEPAATTQVPGVPVEEPVLGPANVPETEAPSTAAPQAGQGTQPETAQEPAGQVGVEPGVVEPAGQVASEVRVEPTEDGTWRVVDNAGQVVGVGMTEPEAVEVRDQEIEERAQRGQVVSTTMTPQPQAAPQEPITPEGAQPPITPEGEQPVPTPVGDPDALPVQEDPATSPEAKAARALDAITPDSKMAKSKEVLEASTIGTVISPEEMVEALEVIEEAYTVGRTSSGIGLKYIKDSIEDTYGQETLALLNTIYERDVAELPQTTRTSKSESIQKWLNEPTEQTDQVDVAAGLDVLDQEDPIPEGWVSKPNSFGDPTWYPDEQSPSFVQKVANPTSPEEAYWAAMPNGDLQYFATQRSAVNALTNSLQESGARPDEDSWIAIRDPNTLPPGQERLPNAAQGSNTVPAKIFTKVGAQAGSNKGGWYSDADGKQYYIKEPKSLDHGISEQLAQILYAVVGVSTPAITVETSVPGLKGPVLASAKVTKYDASAPLKDGFVTDAWLGNWDVVGDDGKNYITFDGNTVRIDFGGALRYRAQGGLKGSNGTKPFGNLVTELSTMRDPAINSMTAAAFKDVTDADIVKQAEILRKSISPEQILGIVDAPNAAFDGKKIKDAEALAKTLIARRQYILDYAATLQEKGDVNVLQDWMKDWDASNPTKVEDALRATDPHELAWAEIPANNSRYGVLVIDPATGKVLMREPTNHYDGYNWTFAKGGKAPGEHPLDTAKRETKEEIGADTTIVGLIGKPFYSSSSTGAMFYVGVQKGVAESPGNETQATKWMSYGEARRSIKEGSNKGGVNRDLEILEYLFGKQKVSDVAEYPIKKGAVHAKAFYESGEFAAAFPTTTFKHKKWVDLTKLQKLNVAAASRLVKAAGDTGSVSSAEVTHEVNRIKKAFKDWSGILLSKTTRGSIDYGKPESQWQLKTGTPVVIEGYHGTKKQGIVGDALNIRKHAGSGVGGSDTIYDGGAFYIFGKKQQAKSAGSKVYEFYVSFKNPKVINYNGGYSSVKLTNEIAKAKAAGYDGLISQNMSDIGGEGTQYIVWHRNQVKTRELENLGYSPDKTSKIYESWSPEATIQEPLSISDFVAEADGFLGQGWTQRAIDAGILKVNETSPEGKPSGTYNLTSGQISINLDKFKKGQSILSVLLHENAHASMDQMLGKQFTKFHADLLKLAKGGSPTANDAMTRAVLGLGRLHKHLIPNQLDDKSLSEAEHKAELERVRGELQEKFPEYLKEEEMAYYVQLVAEGNPTEAGYWNRLKTAIQAWIAQTDFGKAMATIGWRPEMSEQLAVELAKQAAKQTVQRAELVNRLLAERGRVLGNLSAGQRVGVMEAQQQYRDDQEQPRSELNNVLESRDLEQQEAVSEPHKLSPSKIKELDAEEKVTLYRAMALIDGKLYPPMSAKAVVGGLRPPEPLNEWQRSEEKPEFVPTEGRNKGKFPLKKPGGGTTWALYAPYFHASSTPLNDQFTAAWKNDGTQRPQLVTVEVEVPKSEMENGYQAEGSVKKTGPNTWNSGVVASKIPGGREVMLSRYLKIKRIVPDAEVAEKIAGIVIPNRLQIPENTVTPQLRSELEKQGVVIAPKGTKGDAIRLGTLAVAESGVPDGWLKDGKPDEAAIADTLNSLPPLRDLKERHTWFTSPASTMPEDYNVPGVFNKVLHGLVDRFEYVKGKSANLYRAFDEWKNRQGAMQQEIQRTYLDPMRQLVSQYKPGDKDLDPIYSTDVANGKDKPIDQYTTVEIVGHQLAARHIIEDGVTEKLALKAAPKFLKELKKALTPHDVGLLNADIKQITGGSVDIKKLSGPQAKKLFESYLATLPNSSKVKQDLSERWVLFNRRSAGYSIAEPGSLEAQMDATEGFINAHDLYTPGVQGRKSFQRIAELSDQLAAHQLKMLQEGDMLTQEAVDRLQGAYKHYVPLRREAFDYDQELAKMFEKPKSGVGKMMTRKGSISEPSAVHVLQNHLAAGFTAASAAARNQMMNKFYDEVNQDRNGWKPWFKISDKRENNGSLGLIRKGKPLYIVPKEGNLRAASIAKVISGQDAQELSGPLRIMRTVNSWIRWSNVSASPAFILANTPRDYLTAAYNLKASDAADYEKEIRSWTNYKDSFKALHKVIVQGVRESNDPQEQQWIELVEDFEKAGGKTSFVEALRAMDGDSWKSFEAQVGRRQGKLKEVVNFGADKLEWVENLNIALENVMRLSTYKVMRSKVGKERAAEIARNLTTNFTRRGAHVDAINTWWLFYNATVQGNWQVVQNLFLNPNKAGQARLRKAVAGTILFAFMIDQLGRAMSDDEDEDGVADWDARPDWEKERKISSPIAIGGVYPSIPAPWVFNVFWRIGGMLGEVKDGVLKPQDATLDLVGLTTSAMNPIGGGTAAQTIAPSALDPLMQIVENKNFVGNPLGPDGYPGASARPDAYLAWDSTPGAYKSAAEFVNGLTGGSPVESGAVDVRPSSIKVLADFALGGLGRTMLDLGKLGMSPFNDDLGFDGPEKVPGLKTFLTAPSDGTAISKYHDRVAKVLGADKLTKLYSEGAERDPKKLAEVQHDRAAVLRMVPQVKDTERQIKSLRKTMRSAQARGDSRTEKLLRDRITELQKRFNKSYTRRIES